MRALHVILGPTASGKSSYAISHAKSLGNAEIINADSRQLYKYLDIGTAKVTTEEMQGIPHHLLDVLDPTQEATAAWYQKEAIRVIREIHDRDHTPLLVGGSMLYISAVIDGLEFPQASSPELRGALGAEYDQDGGETLYNKLLEIDPDTAQAFSKNNKPYVVRAMEIFTLTKKKPSDVRRMLKPEYDLTIIGIERPRDELHARIDARTKALFERGWIGEVRDLLKRGYTKDDPGMRSVGYREIIREMENGSLDSAQIQKLQEDISAKTRQYAKRQMTWWKRDDRITWITA